MTRLYNILMGAICLAVLAWYATLGNTQNFRDAMNDKGDDA